VDGGNRGCGRHRRLCTTRARVGTAARTVPERHEAPVPVGTRASVRVGQRQRIDMINPITIAPNPIRKFLAPSAFMNPMFWPAT
jgi:hypothetical protein